MTDEGYTTGVQVNQSTGEIVIDQDAKKRTLNYSASLVRAEYDYEAAKANNETKKRYLRLREISLM